MSERVDRLLQMLDDILMKKETDYYMESSPFSRIEEKMANLSKAQQLVANYILRESVHASYSTIDMIAHASNVSTATVVRFAMSLGYTGFGEFQQSLQRHFLVGNPDLINRYALSNRFVSIEDIPEGTEDTWDAIQAITNTHINNLNKTLQGFVPETLHTVVRYLVSAKRIYVSGARTSQSAAQYLNFNLMRTFANSTFLSPDPRELVNRMSAVHPGDVLIVISIRHYFRYTREVARLAKESGAIVIGIFDKYETPLTQYVDHVLVANCKTNIFHSSPLSLVYLADMLVGLCSQAAPKRVKEIADQSAKYRRMMKEDRIFLE